MELLKVIESIKITCSKRIKGIDRENKSIDYRHINRYAADVEVAAGLSIICLFLFTLKCYSFLAKRIPSYRILIIEYFKVSFNSILNKKFIKFLKTKYLTFLVGQNKRIAAIPFFHGCRKRRLKD
jgi:hypothetical protein